ncbi:hypothetical protein PI124_g1945 [Phytophthora idaei]|nr:hypothetical protein PI125_g3966 [Phytophthora idaei]KAG3160177.1 hypothetical protein PI126_g7017 [Phytophthora idaei]KAG3253453.1 hypothetical protein PI124_g1945 [Phytophthora idaei]
MWTNSHLRRRHCSARGVKKTVGHLKIAIKDALKNIAAENLQLCRAGNNYRWLESKSDHVDQLREGGETRYIDTSTQKNKELLETTILENVLSDPLAPDHIHVLVRIPQTKLKRDREEDDMISPLKRFRHQRPTLSEHKRQKWFLGAQR